MFSAKDKHSITGSRKWVANTQSVTLALALSLAGFVASQPVFSADSDSSILKLEMKFFQHDYSKEDMAARLSRVEKLVFGESKSGDTATRLKNLIAAVPNLDAVPTTAAGGDNAGDDQARSASAPSRGQPARSNDDALAQREQQITGSSQYPAVSAIEKKLLNRDFAGEPIAKRLDRLETKVFGKPSQSEDLSDRVDQLKARTGVDLAASPPPGTEWADDDDAPAPRGGGDVTYIPAQTTPFTPSRTPATNLGGSSGSYGGGGGGSDGYTRGGSYGYTPPRKIASSTPRTAPTGMPEPAPDMVREPAAAPPAAMGLNQRVSLLENEIFNKTFINEALPARIVRLENTVFPGKKAPADMSLPERVSRLNDVVGAGSGPAATPQRMAQRADRGDMDDMGDDPQMPRPAPARSGISKVLGGLGNLITGGGYGSYAMGNSNLVTDPQTGMLVDMYSGNIIDPRTGTVVGNRATGIAGGTYGALPYNPYSGFNNGLSPLGGYNRGMGMGMGGIRFGGGGFGMGSGMGTGFGGGTRFGGMGMGTGFGF